MADSIPPGTRFGDYEILEELGAGGMGKVYRARDLTLERLVALKTLAHQFSSDASFVQRFLKEARAAARLNHPNIVQIYDFGCVDSIYYLAMEFVDGHSLGTYLKRGHFSETESIQIIRHACRALSVAHADGIVHRDIKPDNMMLTSRGDVKLVDLGIAKRVDEDVSMTQTGQAIGTPHYISPEQVRGQKDVDGRADIYSLGATLYHLVTGHTPYSGASGPIVMSMHLVEPLPDPRKFEPGLSENICLVLRRMMAKDRNERYADVYALDLDLYRLQCGEDPDSDDTVGTAGGSTARGDTRSRLRAGGGRRVRFGRPLTHRGEPRLGRRAHGEDPRAAGGPHGTVPRRPLRHARRADRRDGGARQVPLEVPSRDPHAHRRGPDGPRDARACERGAHRASRRGRQPRRKRGGERRGLDAFDDSRLGGAHARDHGGGPPCRRGGAREADRAARPRRRQAGGERRDDAFGSRREAGARHSGRRGTPCVSRRNEKTPSPDSLTRSRAALSGLLQ